ncbi:MAG: SDR family NAD(P)-dependent oxidoreductase [Pseudomonadota bacterium]
MKDFKEKVAVITGGASGIGYAIARHSVKEGMKVVLVARDENRLAEAKSELEGAGGTVMTISADVSNESDVELVAQRTLDHFGAVHMLFNNAGVGMPGPPIWKITLSDWEWILGVNLYGVINGLRVFVPIMLEQDTECHIINTSSTAGLVSSPGFGAYNVSKHGVVTLSETLHHELSRIQSKIKVSVICPGAVNTRIMDASRNRPEELQNDPELEAERHAKYMGMEKKMRQGIEKARSPEKVAERVFEAIREEKFYILTHSWVKGSVQIRMEDIIQGRLPTKQ